MKTIAHLPPTDTRMIDLTRSLKLPHGSLSPNTNPEAKWRIEARQDAKEYSSHALYLFLAFLVLSLAILSHYLNA
jgi:hypothetical protein